MESCPIKWLVLSTNGNSGAYKDANGNEYNGKPLFLLSDELLGTEMPFDDSSTAWQGSNVQIWCKDFAGEDGATQNVPSAFTAAELNAVLATTKSDAAYTCGRKRRTA